MITSRIVLLMAIGSMAQPQDSVKAIRANGAGFHYLDQGKGTPVLFVHGGLVD